MIRQIAEEHAEQAAFLWLQRNRASRAPHYDLDGLSFLDDRIEAHLDGLRVAGELGWEVAREALSWEEPGELFTAAVIAIERASLADVALVLDATGGEETMTKAFAAALGWVELATVERLLPGLLHPKVPAPLLTIGIRACAAHRRDPDAWLGRAMHHADPVLRAAGLQAAGELGRSDLHYDLATHYEDEDAACRFWAAWSGTRLGGADAHLPLWSFVGAGQPRAEAALCTLLLAAVDEAPARLQELRARGDMPRLALLGTAVHGDPADAPWLVAQLTDPALARLAGEALATITGTPIRGGLAGTCPEGFDAGPTEQASDERIALDPDEPLRWPDPEAVASWWSSQATAYPAGTRHLLGEPHSEATLGRALREATQPVRARAALELALRSPTEPLFCVQAPGKRQRRALGQ